MIKIELEAESLNELLSKVMTTLGITPVVPAAVPAPVTLTPVEPVKENVFAQPLAPVTLTPVEPVKENVFAQPLAPVLPLDPAKRKVGRPAKVKTAEPESLPLPEVLARALPGFPVSEPVVPETAHTAMVAALNAYVGRKDGGLLKAKEILAKYGYTRVKEVGPEHYQVITEACK